MNRTVKVEYLKNPNMVKLTITPGTPVDFMSVIPIKDDVFHIVPDSELNRERNDMIEVGKEQEFLERVNDTVYDILDVMGVAKNE